MGASAKLRLAIADLTAIDGEVAELSAGVDTIPLSQAAARVSQGAKIAEAAASRILKTAKAASAAATKAAAVVAEAEAAATKAAAAVMEAEAAVALKAEEAAKAAQVAEAAAAAVAALEVAVKPTLPLGSMYVLRRLWFVNDFSLVSVCSGNINWLLFPRLYPARHDFVMLDQVHVIAFWTTAVLPPPDDHYGCFVPQATIKAIIEGRRRQYREGARWAACL